MIPAGTLHSRRLLAALLIVTAGPGCLEPPPEPQGDEDGDTDAAEVAVERGGDIPPSPCPARFAIGDSFVTRDGSQLMLEGRPFRALGTNLYYLQQLYSYGEQGNAALAEPATQALDHVACFGMSVVRTWAFNDSEDRSSMRTAPGVYREEGLRGLDRAVAEAKKRGVRLILSLVNNWDAYGGLPRYAAWAGKARDDFFSDVELQDYWREHANRLSERVNTITGVAYKDEPTILAWEIGNELRCKSCRGTSRYIDTIRSLARHLRQVFPNHLVADGGEGFDDVPGLYPGLSNLYPVRGDEGVSFSKLLEVEELDLLSYHLYPFTTGIKLGREVNIWIDSHETLAKMAGKVPYAGEFGFKAEGETRDAARAPVMETWLTRLFKRNHARISFLWQVIPEARLGSADDGYGVVYGVDARTTRVLLHWASDGIGIARPALVSSNSNPMNLGGQ